MPIYDVAARINVGVKPPGTQQVKKYEYIKGVGDGYDWKRVTADEQMQWCEVFAKKTTGSTYGRSDVLSLYAFLSEFYDTTNSDVLSQPMNVTVAVWSEGRKEGSW